MPELESNLHEAIKRQLRSEGMPEGTPVSMLRYRQALLASSEACEYAHLLYETTHGGEQPPLPCGLKEIPTPGGRVNGNGGERDD
jgi:hypothetical protein